jgi:hypothetical protein
VNSENAKPTRHRPRSVQSPAPVSQNHEGTYHGAVQPSLALTRSSNSTAGVMPCTPMRPTTCTPSERNAIAKIIPSPRSNSSDVSSVVGKDASVTRQSVRESVRPDK